MKLFFLISLLLSFNSEALILKRLSSCGPLNISQVSSEDSEYQKLSEFPKGLFLAREIVHTIESKGHLVYKTHQKLLHESDLVSKTCYYGKPKLVFKSQALLPVLIDQTDLKKVGNAYWKFSFDIEDSVGSSKSQRSLITVQDLHHRLIEQGFQIEKVQVSHAEFELRLKRQNDQSTELYVVLFDRKLISP